jgi:hypothetical protein
MIRLSLTGLAKYMTASPANQRRILRDFKYPNEDEAYAKRLYYREAREHIVAFHRRSRPVEWLLDQAEQLAELGEFNGGMSEVRLKHNNRALRQYAKHFGTRTFEMLDDLPLALTFGEVRIGINPDLHVRETSKEKIIKLDFGSTAPTPEVIKIVSQCLFEAARGAVDSLTSSSALYFDVARGLEHRGARAGARTLAEMEAACETIAAIWPQLRPRRA